jgi:hypothetical protein
MLYAFADDQDFEHGCVTSAKHFVNPAARVEASARL